MKCGLCKKAGSVEGTTNIMLEKDKAIIVFKGVPALICTQCGEAYIVPEVTANLQRIAKEEAASDPKDIFMPYVA